MAISQTLGVGMSQQTRGKYCEKDWIENFANEVRGVCCFEVSGEGSERGVGAVGNVRSGVGMEKQKSEGEGISVGCGRKEEKRDKGLFSRCPGLWSGEGEGDTRTKLKKSRESSRLSTGGKYWEHGKAWAAICADRPESIVRVSRYVLRYIEGPWPR